MSSVGSAARAGGAAAAAGRPTSGEPDELRRLAAAVGLDTDDVEQVIADPVTYLAAVEGSTQQAHSVGINAVPAFVFDRRVLVLGAQPLEVFRRAFSELVA